MPREIKSHGRKLIDLGIKIEAFDGPRGLNTEYRVSYPRGLHVGCQEVEFQRGPVADGFNGIPPEALLAILSDHFENAQHRPGWDQKQSDAKTYVNDALLVLTART